jgi:hypothetical protein
LSESLWQSPTANAEVGSKSYGTNYDTKGGAIPICSVLNLVKSVKDGTGACGFEPQALHVKVQTQMMQWFTEYRQALCSAIEFLAVRCDVNSLLSTKGMVARTEIKGLGALIGPSSCP